MKTIAQQMEKRGEIRGLQHGIQEGKMEVAKNLLFKLHLDFDAVQQATNLPKEELQKIILS